MESDISGINNDSQIQIKLKIKFMEEPLMTQNTNATTTQTTTLTYDQKEFANELAEALQSKSLY